MQIFEVVELDEYPYFKTVEITEGATVNDVITEDRDHNAYLLVDHDSKRIWTYNGPKCPFKMQIYGGISAGLMRIQLKLFYRIFFLNELPKDANLFQEMMEKPLGGGRARALEKEDFPEQSQDDPEAAVTSVHEFLNINRAIELINEIPPPPPEVFSKKFMLIGGNIYREEETTEAFVQEDKTVIKPMKMGRLNNGFTFFKDYNYSTRLVVKEKKVQGIELFTRKEDRSPPLELNIPIIYEEKFSNVGNLEDLMNAFQIPDQLPDKKLKE
jgi:hypothetical protein